MSWQKKARLAIAVFVVVFAAVVFLALQRGKQQVKPLAPPEVIKNRDADLIAHSTGRGSYSHTKEGKVAWTIEWGGTQSTYGSGRSKLMGGVKASSQRGDRKFTITSDEADVIKKEDNLSEGRFTGNVKLTTDDGLEATAAEATYEDTEGIVKVPGAISFKRQRMQGTAVGATYDRNRDVLWLLDKSHVTVAPDAKGQGAMDADAKSIGVARSAHYIRFNGEARVEADGRTLRADEMLVTLTEDDEHVQAIEMRGRSRIDGAGGTGLQMMSANDIDLTYGEDGRTLQFAKLMQNAVVQLAGTGRGPGRRVAGKAIDIAMSPNGTAVTNLNANEQVQLDLPAEGEIPARRIRADSLMAAGAAEGLQEATFTGNVDYRETRAAKGKLSAVNRTARSLRLVVKTKPGLGALQQAEFRGNVRFTDGATTADARHAIYKIEGDRIDLAPSDDPGPATPLVSDGKVEVQARTIELTLATRSMKADTKVRSILIPQKGGKSESGTRVPSVLKQDDVVTITSNRLEYDGAASRATYSGDARLWQGDTTITGDSISLDDKNGNLSAKTGVKTVMFFEQVDVKTKEKKTARQEGSADSFEYDDARRVATYTTGASLTGPEGHMTADKIELYLHEKTNELQRVEAYNSVVLKEAERTVEGTRLTYTVADDRYVMAGMPARPVFMTEKAKTSCREMIGPRLVFYRTSHSMAVEGTSKSGTCGTYTKR